MTEEIEIKRLAGGWFVEFPDGFSGPWFTEDAAKLARAGRFDQAHKAEHAARHKNRNRL